MFFLLSAFYDTLNLSFGVLNSNPVVFDIQLLGQMACFPRPWKDRRYAGFLVTVRGSHFCSGCPEHYISEHVVNTSYCKVSYLFSFSSVCVTLLYSLKSTSAIRWVWHSRIGTWDVETSRKQSYEITSCFLVAITHLLSSCWSKCLFEECGIQLMPKPLFFQCSTRWKWELCVFAEVWWQILVSFGKGHEELYNSDVEQHFPLWP